MKRILFMFTAMAIAMTGCSQTSKQKAPEQKATTVQKGPHHVALKSTTASGWVLAAERSLFFTVVSIG